MEKKTRGKKIKIFLIVLAIALIGLAVQDYVKNGKIREANINAYAFLEGVSKCDISYSIDIMSRKASESFDEECLNRSISYLNRIQFKPGEIGGEKLIVDSQEYNYCLGLRSTGSVTEHKECIRKILPILKEKYPEVRK